MEVNGQEYKIGKLDVFVQMHVVRRLAPVLQSLTAAMEQKDKVATQDQLASFQPVAEAFSKMPDADVDYVLLACLNVVTLSQAGAFVRIIPKNLLKTAFDFITLEVMFMLVYAVLQENLGDFFPVSSAPVTAAAS